MGLRLITPPEELPVSLSEVKGHLRIEHLDEDATLRLYMQSVVAQIDGREGYLGRALMPQTWELTLDRFPCGCIELPLPPAIGIESVKYTDADGNEQTLDPTNYAVDTSHIPARVALAYGKSWPSSRCELNAVRVRFRAGHVLPAEGESEGEAGANVSAAIKVAVLLEVARRMDHRGDDDDAGNSGLSETAKAILHPYRVYA